MVHERLTDLADDVEKIALDKRPKRKREVEGKIPLMLQSEKISIAKAPKPKRLSKSHKSDSMRSDIKLPPLDVVINPKFGRALPLISGFPRIARPETTQSPLRLPTPASDTAPSGRVRLPPLFPYEDELWSFASSRECAARIEVIPPIDATFELIQPLKPVRALLVYAKNYIKRVARIKPPEQFMTSEELASIPLSEGIPKRLTQWFKRIDRRESMRRKSRMKGRLTLQGEPNIQLVEKNKDTAVKEVPDLSEPRRKYLEANHRRLIDDLRINLILKRLRIQLDTQDLVEVMIDLHTGRASKKTKRIVEIAYDTLKNQK